VSGGSSKAPEKPRKFQAIKGVRDILPPETALWNRVEDTARAVFATFGFGEIRVPIFEPTELFARAVGGETDIVSKEMYTFVDHPIGFEQPKFIDEFGPHVQRVKELLDRGEIPNTLGNRLAIEEMQSIWNQHMGGNLERPEALQNIYRLALLSAFIKTGSEISLRPEATASVCRAYIEHGMHALPAPLKLYYMGPMFRRERPQKGRYRQFYQIGAEVLGGGDAPAIDAEVIEMVMVFFARLGLEGAKLHLNSIGCRDCRPKYVELLRAELSKVREQLGPDSQRRIDTNPLRVLDSKLESEQGIIAMLPRIAAHLCDACAKHYAEVKRQLALRGVAFEENWRLVRGLDYYMRTTFEIIAPGLGSQNAVCGGGRYDGLVELLGGHPTKGIGFAIGEDRLILSLQESGKVPAVGGRDVYIAWMGEKAYATAVRAARLLREAGCSVELPGTEQKFGKALGHADKLGARYALILGEDEVSSGQWTLKTLADGTQAKFTEAELLQYLRR
jgi:histidyl-tRNA synthetase